MGLRHYRRKHLVAFKVFHVLRRSERGHEPYRSVPVVRHVGGISLEAPIVPRDSCTVRFCVELCVSSWTPSSLSVRQPRPRSWKHTHSILPTRVTELKTRTAGETKQPRRYKIPSTSSTRLKTLRQVAHTPPTRTPTRVTGITARLHLPSPPVVDHHYTERTPRGALKRGPTLFSAPRLLLRPPDTRPCNTRNSIVAPWNNATGTVIRTSCITTKGLTGLQAMDRRMIMPTGHPMVQALVVHRQETQVLMEASGLMQPDRKRCPLSRHSLLARQAAVVAAAGAEAAGVTFEPTIAQAVVSPARGLWAGRISGW